jgi:methyltransferase (TIGR00027 family)
MAAVDAVRADAIRRDGREQTRVGRLLRAFLAARSRCAEDELVRARNRGVTQYVVLGAGLDTFACRNPFADVKVFEVDHPATQALKRERLTESAIPVPPSLTFVPVDFERQTSLEALRAAAFDDARPAMVSWLGVTMYLTDARVLDVLREIAGLPRGSAVVFDYAVAPERLGPAARMALATFVDRAERAGEPWIGFHDPEELARRLQQMGFSEIEDLGREAINQRYFANRTDDLHVGSIGRIVIARRGGS